MRRKQIRSSTFLFVQLQEIRFIGAEHSRVGSDKVSRIQRLWKFVVSTTFQCLKISLLNVRRLLEHHKTDRLPTPKRPELFSERLRDTIELSHDENHTRASLLYRRLPHLLCQCVH